MRSGWLHIDELTSYEQVWTSRCYKVVPDVQLYGRQRVTSTRAHGRSWRRMSGEGSSG